MVEVELLVGWIWEGRGRGEGGWEEGREGERGDGCDGGNLVGRRVQISGLVAGMLKRGGNCDFMD